MVLEYFLLKVHIREITPLINEKGKEVFYL